MAAAAQPEEEWMVSQHSEAGEPGGCVRDQAGLRTAGPCGPCGLRVRSRGSKVAGRKPGPTGLGSVCSVHVAPREKPQILAVQGKPYKNQLVNM